MKHAKKLICIALLICMLTSLFACADEPTVDENVLQPHTAGAIYTYGDYAAKHDKAMIMLPGLMASALYDKDTNEEMWSFNRIFSLVGELALFMGKKDATVEEKHAFLDSVVASLSCDENNVPETILRVGNTEDKLCYDAWDGMSYIYKILEEDYGDSYDVVCWQYDWRQHNMGAAEQLEQFINNNGWDKVEFFTHSMGGIVVANYLTRSQTNRDKVELFMPFGAPFLGSMDAITNMFPAASEGNTEFDFANCNVVDCALKLYNGEDIGIGLFEFGEGLINYILEADIAITDITRTLPTIYELLPFAQLNDTAYFKEGNEYYTDRSTCLSVNGTPQNGDEFISYLNSFAWTKKADGTTQMPVVANLANYRDKFFMNNAAGEKVFVTELVPTEYVVGIGINTIVGCDLNANGEIAELFYSDAGDGTVPAYSGTVGLPLDHERVHVVEGIQHGPLLDDKGANTANITGLQYVREVVAKYAE